MLGINQITNTSMYINWLFQVLKYHPEEGDQTIPRAYKLIMLIGKCTEAHHHWAPVLTATPIAVTSKKPRTSVHLFICQVFKVYCNWAI